MYISSRELYEGHKWKSEKSHALSFIQCILKLNILLFNIFQDYRFLNYLFVLGNKYVFSHSLEYLESINNIGYTVRYSQTGLSFDRHNEANSPEGSRLQGNTSNLFHWYRDWCTAREQTQQSTCRNSHLHFESSLIVPATVEWPDLSNDQLDTVYKLVF